MDLSISVINKVASLLDGVLTCANSEQMITFSFDEEWDGITDKKARFSYVRDGEWKYTDRDIKGNKVEAPILYDITEVEVGVYGGALKTSTPARVPCRRSALCGNRTPEDPTPDVYAKILEQLKGKVIKDIGVVDNVLRISFTDGTMYESESLKGDSGAAGSNGKDGQDYILTDSDRDEIANLVLSNFTDVSEVGM